MLVVAGLAATLTAPHAGATPPPITVQRPYVQGGVGDVFAMRCDAQDSIGGVGGVCFDLRGTERRVDRITIADTYANGPIGGLWQFTTNAGLDLGDVITEGTFCGTVANVPIPPRAVSLVVYVDGPLFGPLECHPTSLGVGIRGKVYATLSF